MIIDHYQTLMYIADSRHQENLEAARLRRLISNANACSTNGRALMSGKMRDTIGSMLIQWGQKIQSETT
ncbi:MAG: hypothetical protein GTO18_18045 [Anaerolineales bacterium]|nr:hypothetical protein [Anaerolineales bacterium]